MYKCMHVHLYVSAQECTRTWRAEVNYRGHSSGAVHILLLDRLSYSETWGPSIKLDWLVMESGYSGSSSPELALQDAPSHLSFYVGAGDEAASTLLTEVSLQPPARKF